MGRKFLRRIAAGSQTMGRRLSGIKWGVSLPFFLLTLFIFLPSITAPNIVQGTCEFPEAWKGSYFQSGHDGIIKIENNRIYPKGKCVKRLGDKHLIYNEEIDCFSCLVINKIHSNVLQYKESDCHDKKPNLEKLCDEINGDDELLLLLRLEPKLEPCPIKGVFEFTYNSGHGFCDSRLSRVQSCSSESRLLFQYEPCPDVSGSQSLREEIECFGSWKIGSQWYFVARVTDLDHPADFGNLEMTTRCFCYEELGNSHNLAVSGSATCEGVLSSHEAHRVLKLTKTNEEISQCDFPLWLDGKWKGFGSSSELNLHLLNSHTFKMTNGKQEIELKCMNRTDISDIKTNIIVTKIHGCEKTLICMSFYKRSKWVVEFDETCETFLNEFPQRSSNLFNITTLVSESRADEVEPCVLNGIFTALNPCINKTEKNLIFSFGCDSQTATQFNFDLFCNEFEINSSFDCIGSWFEKERGTFLVGSSKGYLERNVCFNLDLRRNLFVSKDGCERRPSQTSLLLFFKSDCSEISVESFTSSSGERKSFHLFFFLLLIYTSSYSLL